MTQQNESNKPVNVPASVHKKMKMLSAQEDMTIRDIVAESFLFYRTIIKNDESYYYHNAIQILKILLDRYGADILKEVEKDNNLYEYTLNTAYKMINALEDYK